MNRPRLALVPALVACASLLSAAGCDDPAMYQPCPSCKLVGSWKTSDPGPLAAQYAAYQLTVVLSSTAWSYVEKAVYSAGSALRPGCNEYEQAVGTWTADGTRLTLVANSATRQEASCLTATDNAQSNGVDPGELPSFAAAMSGPYMLSPPSLYVTLTEDNATATVKFTAQ